MLVDSLLCSYEDDETIAASNAHLAHDMLQRAISRKNDRIERSDDKVGRCC